MGEKFKVRVNIEAVYEIELPDWLSKPNAIADWVDGLWHIDGLEDIAKYAANMVATNGTGINWDGIGVVDKADKKYPRPPDTKYTELEFEMDTEIIQPSES